MLISMPSLSRNERLVENEVIFRDANKNVQEFIEIDTDLPLDKTYQFYCECSRPDCLEHIKLTISKYKELHQKKRHFVILTGHEFKEVEKVIKKNADYEVVEKHFYPPRAKNISSALHSISESI
jgi:hypothetical protein